MMSTLRRRIDDEAERRNPNVTKVVVDRDDFALYFSRAPIPFARQDCPAGARVAARRPVRLPPRLPAAARGPAADRDGTFRGAGTAAGARARHPHQGRRNRLRFASASTRRKISSACGRSVADARLRNRSVRGTPSNPEREDDAGPHGERAATTDASARSNTSSSPAASSRRSARDSRRRRSARCSRGTATRSRCRSSTRTSTSIRAR